MADGNLAEVIETEAQPAEAPAAEGSSQSEAAGTGGEAGGNQPQAGTQPDSTTQPEAVAEPQNMVPYTRFREARTRGTQIQQQFEQAQTTWADEKQQFEEKIAQLESGTAEQQQIATDYRDIVSLLRANPDIYSLLEARAREADTPHSRGTGANGAQALAVPPELKKLGETTARLEQRFQAQEAAAAKAAQQAANAKVEQQLSGVVSEFLTKKNYGKEMAPLALDYVLQRAEKMVDMDFDDVPFVLNEWFALVERGYKSRQDALLKGKQEDANLPPNPGGSQGPIHAQPQVGANDGKTAAHLESLLRSKLGW